MLRKTIIGLKQAKKELWDAFYLILLQGVNQLLPIIVMPYLMLVLGADKYGYIGFSQSVIQYLVLIVDFGFNLSATKRMAMFKDNPKQLNLIFYSTLYAKIALLLISTFIFVVLLLLTPTFHFYSEALLCTYPMVIGSAFSFYWLYQGLGKIRIMAIMNTVSKVLILPLIFFLIKSPGDYILAAFIQSSIYVFTAIISCLYLFKWKIIGKRIFSMRAIWYELKESFPLFLSTAATSFYTQLFVVILGFIATPAVVGNYSAAERIMRALCFVLYVPINQAFFPKISSLSLSDSLKAKKLFKMLIFLVGGIMFLIFLFLYFGGDKIADYLGGDYKDLGILLKIFSIAPMAIGIGGFLGQMGLIALGNFQSKILFQKVYIIVAPISLILVFALASLYNEFGAAWALVATEYLVFVLMYYFYKKDKKC